MDYMGVRVREKVKYKRLVITNAGEIKIRV